MLASRQPKANFIFYSIVNFPCGQCLAVTCGISCVCAWILLHFIYWDVGLLYVYLSLEFSALSCGSLAVIRVKQYKNEFQHNVVFKESSLHSDLRFCFCLLCVLTSFGSWWFLLFLVRNGVLKTTVHHSCRKTKNMQYDAICLGFLLSVMRL
jgi:hypothetical protein